MTECRQILDVCPEWRLYFIIKNKPLRFFQTRFSTSNVKEPLFAICSSQSSQQFSSKQRRMAVLNKLTSTRQFGNLFVKATSVAALEQGWSRVRSNGGCSGGDGETIERFSVRPARKLAQLSRDLRNGSYRPLPLRVHEIEKPSGGIRRLAIPSVRDRIIQTAMAQTLMPVFEQEFEDESFGYRPGRGVAQAVAAVERHRRDGYEWIVDADITRFFDQTPHDPLLVRLEQLLGDQEDRDNILALIELWLELAGQELGSPGCGLPQGSPLSPILANLYLDAMDEGILERNGLRLVRYADDFLILAKSKKQALVALEDTAELLETMGLSLNPEKTRIVDFERGVRFLGHLFVGTFTLQQSKSTRQAGDTEFLRGLALADKAVLALKQKEQEETALERSAGLDAAARVLYVLKKDRRLSVTHSCFVVTQDIDGIERDVLALPHARVDRIEVGPLAHIDDSALRFALGVDTEIVFLSSKGDTLGRAVCDREPRAALHLAQAEVVLASELRTDLSRRLVEGRIRNQRAALRRLNRTKKDADVAKAATALSRVLRKLVDADDTRALMGHEGAAGAIYWPALGRFLPEDTYLSETLRRTRNPPADAFNATVSYLSMMLTRDVSTMVRRASLHPGFGVLHTAQDYGEACVYDLIEEFRAAMTETLAVGLFNKKILSANDDFSPLKGGGFRISGSARGKIIKAYEQTASRGVKSARSDRRLAWRALILEQAYAYAAHCRAPGSDDSYMSYVMDY